MSKSLVVALKALVVPIVPLACLTGPIAVALARDRDHDRLPDRWERRHGLSLKRNSARRDPDRDRLRNRREYRLRLNPRRADTDHDGLRDRAEIKRWRTNPRRRDTDRDGLPDRAEIRRWKTNPRRADTDGDGFNDGVEILAGTNPRNRRSHPRRNSPAPPPADPGTPPAPRGFPSPSTTGVPAGWTPAQVRTADLNVTQPGAVVQDVLLQNANLTVDAPNVTIRRVKLEGGWINNQPGSVCRANGLTIEDTTIEPPPGQTATKESEGVVSYGGYTARRVKIWRRSEGFRVSGKEAGCGPVWIEDSFVKIVDSGDCALHADGIQGYGGDALTVVNTTVDGSDIDCGTAPFFYPRNQGNTRADVSGLLVMGAGYSFRDGMPGSVQGLKIVNGSWIFGPIDVRCSVLSSWQADIVDIDANYQVTRTVRSQPCNTETGG
jgi:Bacterial TSP3 repeat/Clostridial binary toxin B/anthrax toxin PA Ca-binding domain